MSSLLLWLIMMTIAVTNAKPNSDEQADLHPMLYFDKTDTPRLRIEASFSHSKISRSISEAGHALTSDPWRYLPPKEHKAFASIWNEQYGNNLCAFSFYCILHPDDKQAFEYVRTFLDRMEAYENWYVGGNTKNDVGPLSHILTGFATAYDFLYDRLDPKRRQSYYNKIKGVTSEFSKIFDDTRFGFMRERTHSQASSNIIGFLIGALIVSSHEPTVAAPWIQKSQDSLDFALELLSYVVDGSSSEGVSYGSYTSRALTQYVYLAKRHFNKDHSRNRWLQQHFWFYYHTILPGFQRTVGIADSNYNWLYGPESQILFLDSQILRNGYGKWLTEQIQAARVGYRPIAPSSAQIWSSHHTEFLFYDPSIPSLQPESSIKPILHIFSDWGVVAYGGSQALQMGRTYFSFKCGAPGGEAARDIIHSRRYNSRIEGWENFKPGHEHPDHNSFIFIPNGRYVISEALHGPKMTYLENTVTFAPSPTSLCNHPWEGQLGECERWLKHNQYTGETIRGEILTAASVDSMAFVAGEAVGMYSKELKLSSMQRSVLLLNPEVLLVLDNIRLQRSSTTKKASAFFHNIWTPFKPYKYLHYNGAKVEYPEGDYSFFSVIQGNQKINVSIHNGVRLDGLKEGPTNYVNVTFDVIAEQTRVLHIFHGPTYRIANISVEERPHGIIINVTINGKSFNISISTLSKSSSRDIFPVKERRRVTGYSGYATVSDGKKTRYFGFANNVLKLGKHVFKRHFTDNGKFTPEQRKELPDGMAFTSSFDDKCNVSIYPAEDTTRISSLNNVTVFNSTLVPRKRVNATTITGRSLMTLMVKPDKDGWKISVCVIVIKLAVFIFYKVYASSKRESMRRNTRTWQYLSRLSGFMLLCMAFINFGICIDENGRNICVGKKTMRVARVLPSVQTIPRRVSHRVEPPSPQDPFIMISSLPGSGVDVLEVVFGSANFLNYIPSMEINIPSMGMTMETDPCIWTSEQQQHAMSKLWFRSMTDNPILHFNQQRGCDRIKRRLRENGNAPIVLGDDTGFWTTKMPWVSSVVGAANFRPILVVRDPRSWIHVLLSKGNGDSNEKTVGDLTDTFERLYDTCGKGSSSMPYYYQQFQEEQTSEWHIPDDIEKLAMIWTIVMGTAMANAANDSHTQWPLHIVRFEDMVTDTEATITNMFGNLGLPLSIKALNKILRVVESGHYSVPYDGRMNPEVAESWKSGISDYDIAKIDRICGGMMEVFGYKYHSNQ